MELPEDEVRGWLLFFGEKAERQKAAEQSGALERQAAEHLAEMKLINQRRVM